MMRMECKDMLRIYVMMINELERLFSKFSSGVYSMGFGLFLNIPQNIDDPTERAR